MSVEQGKNRLVEASKNFDKAVIGVGGAVYLLAGVPFALFVAGLSAVTLGATVGAEKMVKKFKDKIKGKNK